MTETYFFDSYALIEIIHGNKDYEEYANVNMVITKLNIFEVYYILLRNNLKEIANEFIEKYMGFAVDFDEETIVMAANLKLDRKKSKLSMADCVGYTLAKNLNIKFLTGDKEFKDLDNVEFVK